MYTDVQVTSKNYIYVWHKYVVFKPFFIHKNNSRITYNTIMMISCFTLINFYYVEEQLHWLWLSTRGSSYTAQTSLCSLFKGMVMRINNAQQNRPKCEGSTIFEVAVSEHWRPPSSHSWTVIKLKCCRHVNCKARAGL